ncbi:ornithine decarboxylase 2-like protein, partial [Dinothrombium tinctorium]
MPEIKSFGSPRFGPLALIKSSHSAMKDIFKNILCENINNGRSFYFVDLEDVVAKHQNWIRKLPQIRPFYAVKCNTTDMVLRTLANLGTGFDCASQREIEIVLDIGVKPERIIFANPCKTIEALQYAKSVGVDLMTFDSEEELYKIKQHFPEARVVLRIKTNDSAAKNPLSIKYGTEIADIEYLTQVARNLNLNLMGISFHVGSNTGGVEVYRQAIRDARYGFDVAKKYGFQMTLLDIGGGYPGNRYSNMIETTFAEIAVTIKESISAYFNTDENIEIIAEPGRYFVASAFTLITKIVSRKVIAKNNAVMYYLMDGIYGAFANGWCDFYNPELIPLISEEEERKRNQMVATFWGPTCDSVDCVAKNIVYPEMKVGEWVFVKDMGAYSLVAGSKFNGFDIPPCIFALSVRTKTKMSLPLTPIALTNNGATV